ncbi:SpoIIE family protein phosphatase [Streptomyces pini]|uniref:protein-serine/threonine phosphatase n=1 Tax=Streptomyces pini TaxID=1520580 RepID=A0A1I4AKX4_9ACTN|nr:SpoIIE family protein phosphatase [Streptomyces pini]SFK56840.1 Serine phosphatase RsbU, regulator of sigma subunit [Streptomyces pini]
MAGADDTTAAQDRLETEFLEVVRGTGASAGGLYLLTPDGDVLRLAMMCGAPPGFVEPWKSVGLAAPVPAADAVREDRLVWVGGQEDMARIYPRAALTAPYHFALAAAPVAADRSWGALLLLWPGTHSPRISGRRRDNIVFGCRRLARLLEEEEDAGRPVQAPARPRLLSARTVRTGRSQSALAAEDFAERLPGGSCALDLEGRMTFVSSGGAELLGRSAAELLGTRPWHTLPWLDDPVYEDRYRAAVVSREPVSFAARRPPGRWLDFRLYPDASGISVRIEPAGTGSHPAPVHGERAGRAAPARAGQLYQLMHLAAALTETVGVRDVVDLIADQIMPAFDAEGVVLSVLESGRLRIIGHRGYATAAIERLEGVSLDTALTPAGRVLAEGAPLFYSSPEEMEREYPGLPRTTGKQAWAYLPLSISGRPVGCCTLSYGRPHAFTAEERAVLTSLAGLIAQALDRARLYDTKHQIAHGLQQALLPHTLPAVPGLRVAARYLPATRGMEIGGDFYDLIRLSDSTAAAVIGDVQGHNVAAAALMGQVRTAIHAHATAGVPPDQVLARTNRLLTDLDPGLFTSCLYVHLDLARRCASMASAGHPSPLLRLPDGRTRPLDVPPGLLLGVEPDTDYQVFDTSLPAGAVLALYTDGLVETPGGDPDEATAGLARHLADAPDGDLERLVDAVIQGVRPTRQRTDDIALLLLRTVFGED